MSEIDGSVCLEGATDCVMSLGDDGVEPWRLRAALKDLVGGILVAPGEDALRSAVLWKALLVRAILDDAGLCREAVAVRSLGLLGRRLTGTISGDLRFLSLSEVDEPCEGCEVGKRLSHVEKALASIETKLDCLLSRVGGSSVDSTADGGRLDVMSSLDNLRDLVGRSLHDSERIGTDNDYKAKVIEEMADGADKFLSGLLGRFKNVADRDLFLLLICREDVGGAKHVLTYEEIGNRLGGLTKQAAHARSKEFRHRYPQAWQYVMSIRRPVRADNYSELSPSDRRKGGIDDSYNYDAE